MFTDRLTIRCALMAALITLAMFFGGCQAIEGIFKAGVWTGIIVVVLVVGVVIWVISSLAGRK